MASGILVSLIGFVAAALILCCRKVFSQSIFLYTLRFLFALACGALVGDVLVHILPEAFENEDAEPLWVAGIFIMSLFFFLFLERIFSYCGVQHKHWHDGNSGEEN